MKVKELAYKITDALKQEGVIANHSPSQVEHIIKNAIHVECDLDHAEDSGEVRLETSRDPNSVPNDAERD